MKVEFPADLQIARQARLLPMAEIAAKMGIDPHLLEPYGHDVAKIKLDAIAELQDRPKAKYVVVSAITPTPLGEGKTTTTVGLGDALGRIGKRATVAIRQPSMGPTFGIKGGAAGGGYSQVVPMERLNLQSTLSFQLRRASISRRHLSVGSISLNVNTWKPAMRRSGCARSGISAPVKRPGS